MRQSDRGVSQHSAEFGGDRRSAPAEGEDGASAEPRPRASGGARHAGRFERETLAGQWCFYRDAEGKWRWRCVGSEGEVLAVSTRGFAFRFICEANAFRRGWNFRKDPGAAAAPAAGTRRIADILSASPDASAPQQVRSGRAGCPGPGVEGPREDPEPPPPHGPARHTTALRLAGGGRKREG